MPLRRMSSVFMLTSPKNRRYSLRLTRSARRSARECSTWRTSPSTLPCTPARGSPAPAAPRCPRLRSRRRPAKFQNFNFNISNSNSTSKWKEQTQMDMERARAHSYDFDYESETTESVINLFVGIFSITNTINDLLHNLQVQFSAA